MFSSSIGMRVLLLTLALTGLSSLTAQQPATFPRSTAVGADATPQLDHAHLAPGRVPARDQSAYPRRRESGLQRGRRRRQLRAAEAVPAGAAMHRPRRLPPYLPGPAPRRRRPAGWQQRSARHPMDRWFRHRLGRHLHPGHHHNGRGQRSVDLRGRWSGRQQVHPSFFPSA